MSEKKEIFESTYRRTKFLQMHVESVDLDEDTPMEKRVPALKHIGLHELFFYLDYKKGGVFSRIWNALHFIFRIPTSLFMVITEFETDEDLDRLEKILRKHKSLKEQEREAYDKDKRNVG
jgi:hypothetical protein